MNLKMHGVYTALITPFDSRGQVCEKTLIDLLHHQEKGGVEGVVMLGTTSEEPTLEEYERDFILKITVRELKGKMPIIVGCGSYSTKKTIAACLKAQELGADAVLIVTPYYNRPTQEGIFLHYQAICEETKLPICLYNIPGRCGQNIDVQTIVRLAEFPNVIGIKECNFSQAADIVEKICHKRTNFSLLSGDDPVTLPLMALGGHGVISVLSNLVPRAVVHMVQALSSGNLALARAMHYALKPLAQAITLETNPIPIKYLMHLANLDSGRMRLPMCTPIRANQEKLQHIFESCRHIIEEELYPERFAGANLENTP